jgi:hypothetical protein
MMFLNFFFYFLRGCDPLPRLSEAEVLPEYTAGELLRMQMEEG